VKKQVELNEYKHYDASILWRPISKGIDNVKNALKIGAKDIWGALKYTFDIAVTTDKESIKKIKDKRNAALNKLSTEYVSLWGNIVSANEDMTAFAMMAAPGPYLAAYLTTNGRARLHDISEFCKDVGIPSSMLEKYLGNPVESEKSVEYVKKMMLRRATDGSQSTEIQSALNSIVGKIERIMKFNSIEESSGVNKVRNMLLLEIQTKNKKETPEQEIRNGYIKLFQSDEFNKIVKNKIKSQDFLKLKQDEVKSYVAALNAPIEFIKLVENATSLDEIPKAYKMLGNTILKIDGLDGTDPIKKIQEEADKEYQEIEKIKNDEEKNKVKSAFIKAAQIKIDPEKKMDDKEKEGLVRAAIIKANAAKQLEHVKEVLNSEELNKTIEEAKKEFIEKFMTDQNGRYLDDKTLSAIKKIDSTLPDLISSGVQEIKNAGLLKK
jgi:hypothetical protein